MMKNKKAIALAVSAMSVAGSVVPTFAAEERSTAQKPTVEKVNVNVIDGRDVEYVEAINLDQRMLKLESDSKNPVIVGQNKNTKGETLGYFVEFDKSYSTEKVAEQKQNRDAIVTYLESIQNEKIQGTEDLRYTITTKTSEYEHDESYDNKVKPSRTVITVQDNVAQEDGTFLKDTYTFINVDTNFEVESDTVVNKKTIEIAKGTDSDANKTLSKYMYELENNVVSKGLYTTTKFNADKDKVIVRIYKSDKVTQVGQLEITITDGLSVKEENKLNKLSGLTELKQYLVSNGYITGIPFADVFGHWAQDDILDAFLSGIVDGYEDGTFKAEANITRAEFAKIICTTFNILTDSVEPNFDPKYKDIQSGDWEAEYVLALDALGVVNGYGDGTFRPDQTITRQEAAVIVASLEKNDRYWEDGIQKYKRVDTTTMNSNGQVVHKDIKTQFADDAQIDSWADEAVQFLADKKIVQGYQNKFNPANSIKRAEAVTMVMNAK